MNGALDDVMVASLDPEIQISAQYGLLDNIETFTATNGTATAPDSLFTCSITNDVGSYAVIRSLRSMRYAAPTEDWTYFDSWSEQSPTWLDPSKLNIYRVVCGYLGAHPISFYILNPHSGKWELVHRVVWSGLESRIVFNNPTFKIGWALASLGSAQAMTLTGGSAGLFMQGPAQTTRESRTIQNTKSVSTTFTNLLTIRSREEFAARASNIEIRPKTMSAATESSQNTVVVLYKNNTVDGTQNFQYLDQTNSVCEYDTAGTTLTTIDGKLVSAIVIPSKGNDFLNLEKLNSYLSPGETLTVAARVTSGAASNVTIALSFEDDV